jgi:hypothetical protein
VLYGASPVSASAIELAIDEDQLKDSERSHTSERVAYIVLAEAAAGCSEAADCDDGNGCTDDLCLEGGQCQHLFNQAPCDDGDECTLGDACSEGICSGTPDPSCAGCGDGICAGGGLGEDCATCPADCACIGKNCKNGCCGNGSCDKSESSLSCPVDCL